MTKEEGAYIDIRSHYPPFFYTRYNLTRSQCEQFREQFKHLFHNIAVNGEDDRKIKLYIAEFEKNGDIIAQSI